jgi:formamidopyrimidine-DNA glycosylase
MQALSERISAALLGARFRRIDPLAFSALKTVAPQPESLIGTTLTEVGRRGKFVILETAQDGGRPGPRLMLHLSQGGRVVFESSNGTSRPRGGVVRFVFDRPPSLLVREFGTERKAGWWVVAPGEVGPLAKLGPEPDSDEFRDLILHGTDTGRIHAMLRDQRRVAGIGRGYADDVLHRAKLSPYRSLSSLDPGERERLLAAIHDVLEEAVALERTREGGLPNKLNDHFTIHGRWGGACAVCGSDLRRVSYESHEVTYCPTCQTGGKILADRRLSRLVK